MKIICKVQSGMCNRLVPFITSLRLSKILQAEYYLYWDNDCRDFDYKYIGEKTLYEDMFKKITNISYINIDELNALLSNNKKIKNIGYCQTNEISKLDYNQIQKYEILFFNNYVHPIYTKEDNIIIDSYSMSNPLWLGSNNYLLSVYVVCKLIKPSNITKKKIDEILLEFPANNKNIIGFHVRHWPSVWVKDFSHFINENIYNKRIKLMHELIENNKDIKFYISTSNKKALDELINIFGSRVIYYKNRFGSLGNDHFYKEDNDICNKNKNLNGVVDFFILSKCSEIYAEKASSFSIGAKLMGNLKITFLN